MGPEDLFLLVRTFTDPSRDNLTSYEAIQWVFQSREAAERVLADPENGRMREDNFEVVRLVDTPFRSQVDEVVGHLAAVKQIQEQAQELIDESTSAKH